MLKSYKEKIIHSFDQADQYDDYAVIQKIVAVKLSEYIKNNCMDYNSLDHKISILEIGCGTGFLTEHLLYLFPNAEFVITDISSQMLKRAEQKIKKCSNDIIFKIMDGENPQFDKKFDLICSNLSIQWFHDLACALKKLTNYLKPNGYIICSTLASETFKEWRSIYLHHQFECTLQNYPKKEEFEFFWPKTGSGYWVYEKIIDHFNHGLDFFRELRFIGASVPNKASVPLKRFQLNKIISDFNNYYKYCTYHLAFGIFRKFSAKGFFVTGTDTDVGKTFISACLTKLLNAIYWKPIQTGLNCNLGDTHRICQLLNLKNYDFLKPIIELQAPLSPEEAAKVENRYINSDFMDRINLNSNNTYIIEGAGGVFVPINENLMMIDLIQKINLPVIIVTRTTLGTLNHTLMTIEALRKRHISIAGIVLNGEMNEANKQAIIKHGKVKIIGEIPFFPSINLKELEISCRKINIPMKYFGYDY